MHFLNMKKIKNRLRKVTQSFEVHSNESACRKSGRLGMEQVNIKEVLTTGAVYYIIIMSICYDNIIHLPK